MLPGSSNPDSPNLDGEQLAEAIIDSIRAGVAELGDMARDDARTLLLPIGRFAAAAALEKSAPVREALTGELHEQIRALGHLPEVAGNTVLRERLAIAANVAIDFATRILA